MIARKNLQQTTLKNGGAVDTGTAALREFISRPCHRLSGRNIGLVVLSHPEQSWIDQGTDSRYAFKFKKVEQVNEENQHHMLMKDCKADDKLVLATTRQENLDEQVASIVDHFASLIHSYS